MNPLEHFRLRTQALLARALGSASVAGQVGLRAASEAWGGGEPRELPAWYLWLAERPGAWQLELADAEPLGASGALVGRFTVRYYPAPAEPDLATFGAEEQEMARTWMDASGTPAIERTPSIPPAAFAVGSIDWAVDEARGASALALASLDRLRRRDVAGRLLRDVPGWSLTAPVFSALAGLHAQVDRLSAVRLRLSRRPGFELVDEARLLDRPSDEVVQGEALLHLAPAGAAAAGAELLEALAEPGAEPLGDVALSPGSHPHHLGDDRRLALRLSHAWFGGVAHKEDRIACAC